MARSRTQAPGLALVLLFCGLVAAQSDAPTRCELREGGWARGRAGRAAAGVVVAGGPAPPARSRQRFLGAKSC